ncbi:MAG: divalent-cation tolerance protein CutA [Candidatus Woesearchaeota archaeon]
MAFIIVYVTHPSKEHANKIIDHLLNKKLIACANSFPIESAYWWKGEIARENEIVTILKTTPNNWDAVKKEIESIHDYEVPCIIKLDVQANKAYEDWIQKETQPGQGAQD